MRYDSLDDFLKHGKSALVKGPVAMVFVEDLVEVDATVRHHLKLGFLEVIIFAPDELALPMDLSETVHRVRYSMQSPNALETAVNAVIDAAPGIWLYYCYNAEFLYYPFCETRGIGEMLAFQAEERRSSILSYVIDLYAADLEVAPDAVNLSDAYLDRSGYYALARSDETGRPKERQLNFFGGLRWRFEEHIFVERRKIDRISLFRAEKGLRLLPNHVFSEEEFNTFACPWHHNITAAICSFRIAKALKSNPGSMFNIDTFRWHNSTEFQWQSRQLLDLGLMEPGQWF